MQTKTVSFIEALLNIGSGLLLSALVWVYIGPLFGYAVTWSGAIGFSSIFTVTSIIRSYIWRRVFVTRLDDWLHQRIHGYAKIRPEMQDLPPRVGSIQSLRRSGSLPGMQERDYLNIDASNEAPRES